MVKKVEFTKDRLHVCASSVRILSAAANAQFVRDNCKADAMYQRKWKRYKEFVDKERAAGKIPPGDKYLSRDVVDVYFSEKISKYHVVPDSAR